MARSEPAEDSMPSSVPDYRQSVTVITGCCEESVANRGRCEPSDKDLVEHQVDHHAGYGHVQPQWEGPAGDGPMPVKPLPQRPA